MSIESRVSGNSNSAHRSSDGEPKTEVFIGTNEHGEDIVFVSFVDRDSEDPTGIYMYEPGCDPIELASIGLDGVATEFEHATVVYAVEGGEDETIPGDVLVTGADRDAAVEAATEDLVNLRDAYDTLREQAQALVDAARLVHDDRAHPGVFQWCEHTVCRAARAVEL